MLFPTRHKAKIASNLSYPVGAELISSELGDIPQAQEVEIGFSNKLEWLSLRGKPYQIFAVTYIGPKSSYRGAGWSIDVRPVPRILKAKVRDGLLRECFPNIRSWLEKHGRLDARYGRHSLSVILDESGEQLLRLEEYHDAGETLSN
jgi:hypothetical protein